MFTCDMSEGLNSYSYLFFGSTDVTGFPDKDYSGIISLQNGGCAKNNTIPYQTLTGSNISCCELTNIAGTDCSSGKTAIDFTQQDVEDSCFDEGLQDLQFTDIDRIEFLTLKDTLGTNNVYFDDFYIYSTGIIGNNSLPTFITLTAIPNPANISDTVNWGWNIFDPDDPANETYTAFDCEDDGVLDYGWALRGNVGSGATGFDCIYPSESTYTGRLWFTDVVHYPLYNASATSTVDIILEVTQPEPDQGGTCTGFSSPVCTGDCYFNDDFQYNNPVECNEWEGTAKDVNPASGIFSVYNLQVTKHSIYIEGDTYSNGVIYESQYNNFEVEFDFYLSHYSNVQFDILNNELNKYSAFVIFNNYNIEVYDPTKTTIASVGQNEWHNLKMNIDLLNDKIDWYLDGNFKYTGDFFDGATDSQRRFTIGWSSTLTDFDIDNFKITYGTLNANATVPEEEVEYTYNPDLFCAVNWTGETGHRFVLQNCIDRGYNVVYPLIGLCVPRACIHDFKYKLVEYATTNIFETIIVVTAFILIAPLLVALAKKRK